VKKVFVFLFVGFFILAAREFFHQNEGTSIITGSVAMGGLDNSYLLPYKGNNFSYFSPISYYVFDDAYTHEKVFKTLLSAYAICEKTNPNVKYHIMECSRKNGGNMLFHKTHENGLSVDFMIPIKKNNRQYKLLDQLGLWHYLLSFDNDGNNKLIKNAQLDFESMARHILALDDASKVHGIRIKKVLFKIELKDNFYATPAGKEVRRRGIYLAKALPKVVNNMHDDHYHVDFELM